MDFEFKGVKYFVHRYYKKGFGLANYVYFKDGELLFIDFENEELRKTITILNLQDKNMKFGDFLNEEMLLEMANILRKRHKEMPCNIFISAKNNSKHGPRIKIQNNYSTNLQQENMFSMSIPDLKITGNTDKLKEEDIEYYRKFIKRNEKVLLDYWNGVKEIEDVLEELVY